MFIGNLKIKTHWKTFTKIDTNLLYTNDKMTLNYMLLGGVDIFKSGQVGSHIKDFWYRNCCSKKNFLKNQYFGR